jgi:hypothetical protein
LRFTYQLPTTQVPTTAYIRLRSIEYITTELSSPPPPPLAVAVCANSLKSPPRDPSDPPCHSWRGLVHTNHTRYAESRNGCIQRISGPPSDPEIRHVALAAVPAANLGPETHPEPAPTTHGGHGRNSTGGWLTDDPQGVPPRPRMCGGGGATRAGGKRGRGGAACRI